MLHDKNLFIWNVYVCNCCVVNRRFCTLKIKFYIFTDIFILVCYNLQLILFSFIEI